jgi:hypothetical protein
MMRHRKHVALDAGGVTAGQRGFRVSNEGQQAPGASNERQAVRRFGTGNPACHGYPQYGSTPSDTKPHTVESCRCAHGEPAAREKARAAPRWGELDPIESWYTAGGRLITLTYLVEDDTSNDHESTTGQAPPRAIPLEVPRPDASSRFLLLTVGDHSVRTSGESSARSGSCRR